MCSQTEFTANNLYLVHLALPQSDSNPLYLAGFRGLLINTSESTFTFPGTGDFTSLSKPNLSFPIVQFNWQREKKQTVWV